VPYDCGGCVFDARSPGFHDADFDRYNVLRPAIPEGFAAQSGPTLAAAQMAGCPVSQVASVEAGDMIETRTPQRSVTGSAGR
jgi:5'-3' exonuclease